VIRATSHAGRAARRPAACRRRVSGRGRHQRLGRGPDGDRPRGHRGPGLGDGRRAHGGAQAPRGV